MKSHGVDWNMSYDIDKVIVNICDLESVLFIQT